jgi:hypothetical protein
VQQPESLHDLLRGILRLQAQLFQQRTAPTGGKEVVQKRRFVAPRERFQNVTETLQVALPLPAALFSEGTLEKMGALERLNQVGRKSGHCMKTEGAQAEKSV